MALPLIIKFKGGLGNQLFQYAFGKWAEYTFKSTVYFDTRGLSNSLVARNFELKEFSLFTKEEYKFIYGEAWRQNILPRMLYAYYHKLNYEFTDTEIGFAPKHLKPGIYHGYWQNEAFVLSILPTLRESIRFSSTPIGHSIIDGHLNTVAIHIRGTDYLNHPTLITLTRSYYFNAIKYVNEKINNPSFFVFTDDRPHASRIMEGMQFEWAETGSGITDFHLMSRCQHQISANSTFSWWAAMLNKNPNKCVVAPLQWEIGKVNLLQTKLFYAI